MSNAGRTGLTLAAIVGAGVGGLWAGQRGVALPDLPWLRSDLLKYHFDQIKIDRSFVTHITFDEKHRKIVRSILDLTRNHGIPATAEGIEDGGDLRELKGMGCEIGQGFLFSKAVPVHEVPKLIPGTDIPVGQCVRDIR